MDSSPNLAPEESAKPKRVRVIDSLWTFFVAVALIGPFALPLLWRNPRFKVSTKVAGSVFIILLTWALVHFMGSFIQSLSDQLQLQ